MHVRKEDAAKQSRYNVGLRNGCERIQGATGMRP